MLNQDLLTKMDAFLNVLQTFQLPFALFPLIKFCYSKEIIQEFAISDFQLMFAGFFAVTLYFMNFYVVFTSVPLDQWWVVVLLVLGSIWYIWIVVVIIKEPIKPLKQRTKEQMEEYDQINVIEDEDSSPKKR